MRKLCERDGNRDEVVEIVGCLRTKWNGDQFGKELDSGRFHPRVPKIPNLVVG